MDFEIIGESSKGYLILKTSGSYSVDDNIEMIKQIALHEHWKKGMDVLTDHRHVSFEEGDLTDLRLHTERLTEATMLLEKEYGARRCAIVAPLEGHTKAALYTFFANLELNMVTKLFPPNEYDKAVLWLESES